MKLGQWVDVWCIPESGCCFLFIPLFLHFSFSPIFSGTMRPRRLKLGTQVDSGWMYRVYRNQAAALIRPFISSFFFLSSFQTLKFFITLFSGTVRPRRLKLDSHMDTEHIPESVCCCLFIPLFLHFSFSPIFKH